MNPTRRFTRLHLAIALLLSIGGASAAQAEEAYLSSVKTQALFKSTSDAAGHAIHYPTSDHPELSGYLVEIAPGGETGWHLHPNPCMAYVLSGSIEVQQENGPTRAFKAGDSFVELINTRHNGRNTGDSPVRILLFVVGEQGLGPSKR